MDPEVTQFLESLTIFSNLEESSTRDPGKSTERMGFQVQGNMTLAVPTIGFLSNMQVDRFMTVVGKFGKSPRGINYKSEIPGPGAYDQNFKALEKQTGKGFMSKLGRQGLKGSEIPGPGAYDDETAFKRLSSANGGIKFPKSGTYEAKSEFPGPGAYNGDSTVVTKNNGGVKFGHEPRDRRHNDEKPGPGAYDVDSKVLKGEAKWSFGKAPRTKDLKDDGPGHYDIPHSIPDVPKYNYPSMDKRKIHL